MNQKEVNELRRRFTTEKTAIGRIYGCFVNAHKEILASMDLSLGLMQQTERETYLGLLKKTLSGGLGRTMRDIAFSTKDVAEGEEHALLMRLRNSALADEAARERFFKTVIANTDMDGRPYVILLAAESYDVPYRGSDGLIRRDASDEVFSYILCSICPVNDGKVQLGYDSGEKEFHSILSPQTVGAPELGFMFPAFDDRAANIYNALFYSRDVAKTHEEFIGALFHAEAPMTAPEVHDTFVSVLTHSLTDSCKLDVVQTVHEQICERLEQHKETKDPALLELDADDVGAILESAGVSKEKVEAFRTSCEDEFGKGASLPVGNLLDSKTFEVLTPKVKISVEPDYSYAVTTRVINGRKYILIPADEAVSINGVPITVTEDNE